MPACEGLGVEQAGAPSPPALLGVGSAVAWRTELIFWSSLALGLWLLAIRVSLWGFASCPLPSALRKMEGLVQWSRGSSLLLSGLTGTSLLLLLLLTSSLRSAKSEVEP